MTASELVALVKSDLAEAEKRVDDLKGRIEESDRKIEHLKFVIGYAAVVADELLK